MKRNKKLNLSTNEKAPLEEGTDNSAYRALTPPEFINVDNTKVEVRMPSRVLRCSLLFDCHLGV